MSPDRCASAILRVVIFLAAASQKGFVPRVSTTSLLSKRPAGTPLTEKVVDLWKMWVTRRWNPEARFLNLEVSAQPFLCVLC